MLDALRASRLLCSLLRDYYNCLQNAIMILDFFTFPKAFTQFKDFLSFLTSFIVTFDTKIS